MVLPVSVIAAAIETEDITILQQLPGIGNRAAQKVIATLKGKVSATALLRDGLDLDNKSTSEQLSIRNEAIEAFKYCSSLEGIIPALEPSHALAHLMKIAHKMDKNQIVVMNMCGRGDKDIFTIAEKLNVKIDES